MISNQKLSPKYWVVHDNQTQDVFIDTAHKSMGWAIQLFLDKHAYTYFGKLADEDEARDKYEDAENLQCILIEVNPVRVSPTDMEN